MEGLSYPERLTVLKLYSLQRRRERCNIIYVWKILEGLVPNIFPPICTKTWDRRGRTCITSHINVRRLGTFEYNNFRWRAIRLFNQIGLFVHNTTVETVCSIHRFKKQLDSYLSLTMVATHPPLTLLQVRMVFHVLYCLTVHMNLLHPF